MGLENTGFGDVAGIERRKNRIGEQVGDIAPWPPVIARHEHDGRCGRRLLSALIGAHLVERLDQRAGQERLDDFAARMRMPDDHTQPKTPSTMPSGFMQIDDDLAVERTEIGNRGSGGRPWQGRMTMPALRAASAGLATEAPSVPASSKSPSLSGDRVPNVMAYPLPDSPLRWPCRHGRPDDGDVHVPLPRRRSQPAICVSPSTVIAGRFEFNKNEFAS